MTVTSLSLHRSLLDVRFRRARLAHREWITPGLARLRFEGPDLAGFDSPGADDHVRIFFGSAAPDWTPIDELRQGLSREYTPLYWSADEVTFEFVIHDTHGQESGPASEWAKNAPLGSQVLIGGPRGTLELVGEPAAWLLAGDLTALPAIRRFVAMMGPSPRGRVLLESAWSPARLRLRVPDGVDLTTLAPLPGSPCAALAAALDDLGGTEPPAHDLFAFVAGEKAIVRAGRKLIGEAWGLDLDRAIIKGYWKRGTAEYHAPH